MQGEEEPRTKECSFGVVYEATNFKNKKNLFAVKLKKKDVERPKLLNEAKVYKCGDSHS